ncbi:MAG: shikimate kinase [Clostridiales bacterium]|nr:shikimate kinase [Clostridiales bacterium]
MKKNIVLIGMPGVGKSTIGVVLAKNLGYHFLDSDLLIQETHEKLLHQLIDDYGIDGFLKIEDDVNASICVEKTVIATGGSAVFGQKAMEHFQQTGIVIYLQLSYETINERLGDLKKRGVTLRENQTLFDLYSERKPYYEKYADLKIDCDGKSIREIVFELSEEVMKMTEMSVNDETD